MVCVTVVATDGSHQRHVVATWRTTPRPAHVHVSARGRACQRRNSAPRASDEAGGCGLVPLPVARSMDQVCCPLSPEP